jgi:hypothetical protein
MSNAAFTPPGYRANSPAFTITPSRKLNGTFRCRMNLSVV